MTTAPGPREPAGATAPGDPVAGSGESLLDGGATGTDEGPAGIPAALVGHDRDGDEVGPPPAAQAPGDRGDEDGRSTGPASLDDPLSPSDTSLPQTGDAGADGAA